MWKHITQTRPPEWKSGKGISTITDPWWIWQTPLCMCLHTHTHTQLCGRTCLRGRNQTRDKRSCDAIQTTGEEPGSQSSISGHRADELPQAFEMRRWGMRVCGEWEAWRFELSGEGHSWLEDARMAPNGFILTTCSAFITIFSSMYSISLLCFVINKVFVFSLMPPLFSCCRQ